MMNGHVCDQEELLFEALERGYVGPDLRSHVSSCAPCRELELVAGSLLDDRSEAVTRAAVPSSEIMLWKIKARERREAEARARHSLVVGQAISLTLAAVLIAILFAWQMLPTPVDALGSGIISLVERVRFGTTLTVLLAIGFVAAPLAGFLALSNR